MKIAAIYASTCILWILASLIPCQASSPSVGVYFDPQGTISQNPIQLGVPFSVYVVAHDVPDGLQGVEFSLTIDSRVIVIDRIFDPNWINFGAIPDGNDDNIMASGSTCIDASSSAAVLEVQGIVLDFGDNSPITIGLDSASPSSFSPATPGYCNCDAPVTAANLQPFTVANAEVSSGPQAVLHDGLPHVALGNATITLDQGTNTIVYTGLLSGQGMDGIAVSLEQPTNGYSSDLNLDTASIPVGGVLTAEFVTSLGTQVSEVSMTQTASGPTVSVDFPDLNPTGFALSIVSEDSELVFLDGLPSVSVDAATWPTRLMPAFVTRACDAFVTAELEFPPGTLFDVPGQGSWSGDRLRVTSDAILAESMTAATVTFWGELMPDVSSTTETSIEEDLTVGQLHNAALDDYIASSPPPPPPGSHLSMTEFVARMGIVEDFIRERDNGLPTVQDPSTATQLIIESFVAGGFFYDDDGTPRLGVPVTSDGFVPYVMSFLQGTYGGIGQTLVDRIGNVNDLTQNETPSATILSYVENDLLAPGLSTREVQLACAFRDVYSNSLAYWSGAPPKRLTDNSWIVLNDAIGALYGLLGGPVGSIILGAVFSIGTAEELGVAAPQTEVDFDGVTNTALGSAILDRFLGRVWIGNLGSSGQDGIVADFGSKGRVSLGWDPLPSTTTPGASITFETTGIVGGIADQPLGSLEVTDVDSSLAVVADYTAVGSFTQRVVAYQGTTVLETAAGQTGTVALFPDWPVCCDKGPVLIDGYQTACYLLKWPIPVPVTLANGTTVMADHLGVFAETPTSSIDGVNTFSIRLKDLGELAIHTEDSSAGTDVEDTPPSPGPRGLSVAPNPFNPRLTLSFTKQNAGPTKLEILDLRGRHVATLVEDTLGEGPHEIQWFGRDQRGHGLASGVYIAVLESEGIRDVRKIALVK